MHFLYLHGRERSGTARLKWGLRLALDPGLGGRESGQCPLAVLGVGLLRPPLGVGLL